MSPYRSAGATGRRVIYASAAIAALVVMLLVAGTAVASAESLPEDITFPEVVEAPATQIQNAHVGEELICGSGTWRGNVNTFAYEWLSNGVTVGFKDEYVVAASDKGHFISCNVIAKNNVGTEEEESGNEVCVGSLCEEPPEVPEDITRPLVSGSAAVGETLTCETGTWNGSPSGFAYRWVRNLGLAEEAVISGATAGTYKIAVADEGRAISCEVTASNTAGSSATVASENSVSIPVTKPTPTTRPEVLFRKLEVGQELTCSPGTWTGEPTFRYQWLRNAAAIAGATGHTYTIQEADQLHSISCRVTASKGSVEGEAESSNSVEIPGSAPKDTKAPVIGGTPKVGETLTCSPGQWSGVPAPGFSYQWLRNGTAITAAGKATYTPVAADRGQQISCEVTAKNSVGSAVADSEPVVVPKEEGSPPTPTAPPEVSGEARIGATLRCSEGGWSGTPTPTLTYRWVRDIATPEEVVIPEATSTTYRVSSTDAGYALSCEVTATNSEGRFTEASRNSEQIPGEAPVVHGHGPSISGRPLVGETLACSRGEWTGEPAPSFESRWLRGGAQIASGSSYTVAEADRGYSLTCEVVATNGTGSAAASSPEVHVAGAPPVVTALPSVVGTPDVGEALTCATGKWGGAPAPTFTYRWLVDGTEVPSATSSTYLVPHTDLGRTISCVVTATNTEGAAFAYSPKVSVAGAEPVLLESPEVTGRAGVGNALTCKHGTWLGKPPPEFAIQWLLDGSPIEGASETTYTVLQADVNHSISCVITASNSEGTAQATSNAIFIGTAAKTAQKSETPPNETETNQKAKAVVTAAQVLSRLGLELGRIQHAARLKGLRNSHAYSFKFSAPTAGKLEYSWYQLAHGARLSSKGKLKPMLVATAKASFASATTKTIELKLTSAGLRLIRSSKHIKLTAKAVFSRAGVSPVSWVKSFVLSL